MRYSTVRIREDYFLRCAYHVWNKEEGPAENRRVTYVDIQEAVDPKRLINDEDFFELLERFARDKRTAYNHSTFCQSELCKAVFYFK